MDWYYLRDAIPDSLPCTEDEMHAEKITISHAHILAVIKNSSTFAARF